MNRTFLNLLFLAGITALLLQDSNGARGIGDTEHPFRRAQ